MMKTFNKVNDKRNHKVIVRHLVIVLLLLVSMVIPMDASASSVTTVGGVNVTQSAGDSPYMANASIGVFAHQFKWVYTNIDGNVYKRLFNVTTGQWVGDWQRI